MNIPEEFRYMLLWFHQDVELHVSNEEELIAYLVDRLNVERRKVVRGFLTDLLARNPPGAELQKIWRDCDSDWSFRDDEALRLFLTMVRDRIPAS